MNALASQVEQELPLQESEADDAPPSRTELRHLRIVVDLLKSHRLAVPADEVMRAVTEIEELRPLVEHQRDSLNLLRVALTGLDRAETKLNEKLAAHSTVDINLLSKEQRMERREWETEWRRDVEYARRRLVTAVRALLENTQRKHAPTTYELDQRRSEKAAQPTPPHVWLEDLARQAE